MDKIYGHLEKARHLLGLTEVSRFFRIFWPLGAQNFRMAISRRKTNAKLIKCHHC